MSNEPATRDKALSEIAGLMRAHGLALKDIASFLEETPEKRGLHLQALFAYIGAAFVLGGIGTYMSIVWDDLSSLARVVLSLGSGMTVYALGILSTRDARLERATTPLLSIGAFLQTGGLFVYLYEYSNGGDEHIGQMIVFGTMALQMLASFLVMQRTSLAFLAILAFMGVAQAMMNYADMDGEWIAMTAGLSGLLISWAVDKTRHHGMTPFGYFISSGLVSISSFEILDASYSRQVPGTDMLLFLVSVGLLILSLSAKSRIVLFVAVAHLLFTLGYYTSHYFMDMIGWPIALIVMGMMLIGASAFALRIGSGFSRRIT